MNFWQYGASLGSEPRTPRRAVELPAPVRDRLPVHGERVPEPGRMSEPHVVPVYVPAKRQLVGGVEKRRIGIQAQRRLVARQRYEQLCLAALLDHVTA